MDGRLALRCSVAWLTGSLVVQAMGLSLVALVALVIGSIVALVLVIGIVISLNSMIGLYRYGNLRSIGACDLWLMLDVDDIVGACKMSKIQPSDKPKSFVYSKNGRKGLGLADYHRLKWDWESCFAADSVCIRTSLSFFFELRFPELALAIDLSKVSVCIILFGMVALAEISLQVTVKKHGQGQSSSGPAGGSGAGNAGGSIGGGDENGTIGHGTGQGRRSGIGGGGGGGQGQGNGDDDDNDGRRIVGDVENGRRPRNPTPEEIAAIFLPIIIQSIANIMSLNDAELSTTGRANRYFSMIINLVGFICCAAVIWQPYTNPRVARILNPRISGILSRSGSALAFLGFISMMGIDLPLYLSWIMGLAFLVLLAFFLVDISEARQ